MSERTAHLLDPYDSFGFAHGKIHHRVYFAGKGPAVILMHEMPGLSPECVRFADVIRKRGYTVYLPMFFGRSLQDSMLKGFAHLVSRQIFCLRREFNLLAQNSPGPIGGWVRALTREVRTRNGESIGVIGMCLTGHLVLSMILEDGVDAAVLSEPTAPTCARNLGITPQEISRVRERCENGLRVLGMRFKGDWISGERRFDRLQREIGPALTRHEITPTHKTFPMPQHSMLTYHYDANKSDTFDAREAVMAYLDERLGKTGATKLDP